MVKKFFAKEISFKKEHDCKQDVFAVKIENNYTFLTTSKFKLSGIKNCIGPDLSYDV